MQGNHGGEVIALRFCGFVNGGGGIDYMIGRALLDEPIELFSNGMIYRDYLTVDKAVDAFVLAAAYRTNSGFEAFNIGSGTAVSTYELAKIICAELGSQSEIVLSDRKAARANFVFNVGKAIEHLGFVPEDLRASISAYAMKRKFLFVQEGRNE
jgi:nucleoside-diphosphate-sugar epimerase